MGTVLLATCSRLGRAPRPPLPTVPPGSGTGGAIAGGKAPRARRASRRPRRAPPRAIQRRRAVRVRDAACWLLGRRALQLTPPWASDGTKLPRLVRQETPGGLADAPCSWGGVRKNTSKQVCSTCGRSSPVATAFVQCKADGTVPPGALSAKIQQAKDAIEDALGGLWEDTRVWLVRPLPLPEGFDPEPLTRNDPRHEPGDPAERRN